jgi:hypothetical protein
MQLLHQVLIVRKTVLVFGKVRFDRLDIGLALVLLCFGQLLIIFLLLILFCYDDGAILASTSVRGIRGWTWFRLQVLSRELRLEDLGCANGGG